MAFTPTSRHMAGITRRALGAGAAIALALAATLVLAAPANAHTPKVKAWCDEEGTTLEITLRNYNSTQDNRISVIIDDEVILDDEVVETAFVQTWDDLDPTVDHEIEVDVFAWDDPDYEKGWSANEKLVVEACVVETTTPTTTEETTTSEVAPTTSEEVAPTTSPAGGSSGDLADTGASIAIPIALGVLMLLGGGALLLLVRRRDAGKA